MKKIITFCVIIAGICGAAIYVGLLTGAADKDKKTFAAGAASEATAQPKIQTTIMMNVGKPMMTVNGTETEIDPGKGTVPVVVDDRTLIPVRAVIEALGGSVAWDSTTNTATLTLAANEIKLMADSTDAYLNNEKKALDVAPQIINERTMLPIRFIAESFGLNVEWDGEKSLITITSDGNENGKETASTGSLVTNGGYTIALSSLEHADVASPEKVYYTSDISAEAMMKIYEALGRVLPGKVAVKLSTGEAGDTYYLDPNLIKPLVQSVNGTIVECNTAYGGSRANTEMHRQVAKDHGFTAIADVDIMDADGSMSIPVTNGKHLTQDLVGKDLANYDSVMVLSHFKGHAMAGFGGALKNISIGIGSAEGKAYIHGAGDKTKMWSTAQDDFTESMAEAANAVSDYEGKGEKMLYISVMNNLSVDCDCDSNPAKPTMKNIGILASTDPTALDQACVDLVYAVPDGKDLIERMESRKGIHILEHDEARGFGSRKYDPIVIDG